MILNESDLRSRIATRSDEEIRRIASAHTDEYRDEAITIARDVLRFRGLEYLQSPPEPATPTSRDRFNFRISTRAVVALLAVAIAYLLARPFLDLSATNSTVSLTILAVMCWASTFLDRSTLRNWRSPDFHR